MWWLPQVLLFGAGWCIAEAAIRASDLVWSRIVRLFEKKVK